MNRTSPDLSFLLLLLSHPHLLIALDEDEGGHGRDVVLLGHVLRLVDVDLERVEKHSSMCLRYSQIHNGSSYKVATKRLQWICSGRC